MEVARESPGFFRVATGPFEGLDQVCLAPSDGHAARVDGRLWLSVPRALNQRADAGGDLLEAAPLEPQLAIYSQDELRAAGRRRCGRRLLCGTGQRAPKRCDVVSWWRQRRRRLPRRSGRRARWRARWRALGLLCECVFARGLVVRRASPCPGRRIPARRRSRRRPRWPLRHRLRPRRARRGLWWRVLLRRRRFLRWWLVDSRRRLCLGMWRRGRVRCGGGPRWRCWLRWRRSLSMGRRSRVRCGGGPRWRCWLRRQRNLGMR